MKMKSQLAFIMGIIVVVLSNSIDANDNYSNSTYVSNTKSQETGEYCVAYFLDRPHTKIRLGDYCSLYCCGACFKRSCCNLVSYKLDQDTCENNVPLSELYM